MIINKAKLLEALEIVKPGLANKELIEQSTSFAFINGKVVTYNDEISISHPVEGLELEGAILAENLYKFLGKIKKEEVELSVEGNEIVLTSGRSKAGLTLQSEVKLPLDEEVATIGKWKTLPADFLKFVSFAMTSCGKEMSKPILTCVHVDESGVIESTDSNRITRCHLESGMPVKSFLLPATSAADMIKLKPNKISEGKGWIHFKTEAGTIISCRVFEDAFPNCEPHMKVKGTEVTFPTSIEECLDRAMVFSKRDHILDESITIIIQSKKLTLKAKSTSGWFEETLNIKFDAEPITFEITPYLLKGILKETQSFIFSLNKLKFAGEGWEHIMALRVLPTKEKQ